jgi:hypothetical protein
MITTLSWVWFVATVTGATLLYASARWHSARPVVRIIRVAAWVILTLFYWLWIYLAVAFGVMPF